jgi:hypothetical protein
MLSYLCESLPWCKQIIAIAQNAKAFDLHFILNGAILLKWRPHFIMSGQKFICMTMEDLKFIDIICFLSFALRKLSGTFVLTASKSWYPHHFNSMENLDYVGHIPHREYYGVKRKSSGERTEFLA